VTTNRELSRASRAAVLKLLHPELGDALAASAGGLVDQVVAYLDSVPAASLGDDFPAFSFDPVAASAYLPDPVPLPAAKPRSGRDALADPDELVWLPAPDLARLVRAGLADPAEVRRRYAERITQWEPALNAFIRVCDGKLRPDSEPQPDGGSGRGDGGRLAGVPVGLTDLIDAAGMPTTCGSELLLDHVPTADAESWTRLAAEGAVLAGKLNVHEFAAGTTGQSQYFGWARNPWDTTKMAGGACGGAGAAVAAGLVSVALGPDPGGSIRVPAAHCGVVALKPTYGAISRRGVRALTWTLDTLGVVAQRVAGVAAAADLLLEPRTPRIPQTPRTPQDGCLAAAVAGGQRPELSLRIGVPASWIDMGLNPAVARAFDQALEHLTALGAQVREVKVPYAGDILRMHRVIAFSEASAGHEQFLADGAGEMGANIRDRERAGQAVLAGEYLKAFRIRGEVCREFSNVWRDVDVIATPTVPVPPAPIGTGELSTGSIGAEPTHLVYTRYAAPISTLGLPALSVPCGVTPEGLPIGLQLVGPPHAEPLLFFAAGAYEASTEWHHRHPVLPASNPAADPATNRAADPA
jgi:aspartyl-tRNA(Asn)/glutamyl-tRNA(Gln) amidotransferase subunit A